MEMKRNYDSPLMMIELFAANQAVANCEAKKVSFNCLAGPNIDSTNVITSDNNECSKFAKTTSATVATNPNSNQHSSPAVGGSWAKNGVTFTAEDEAVGLLYICVPLEGSESDYSIDKWTVTNGVLTHSGSHNGPYHCMVTPVYNATNVSTGS